MPKVCSALEQEIVTLEQTERNFINSNDGEEPVLESSRCDQDLSTNFSLNCSEIAQTTRSVPNTDTQIEETIETVKPLQSGVRNFDESIKTALALSCSHAEITTEQTRKAFQVTSLVFFGMTYHLSPHAKKPEHLPITAANLQRFYHLQKSLLILNPN